MNDAPSSARTSTAWQAVLGPSGALPAVGEAQRFAAGGRMIAVFNVENQLFAVDDTCTHRPASLSEDGSVVGTTVVCGWHLSTFDLVTGENVAPPACDGLRTYDLDIGDVIVATERTRQDGPPGSSSR